MNILMSAISDVIASLTNLDLFLWFLGAAITVFVIGVTYKIIKGGR